jgi:hypothetical protein
MKLRHLIDRRKSLVAERVNLEYSVKPDARRIFLENALRQQQEAEQAAGEEATP